MQVIFCTDGIFPHAVGGMQRHSLLLIRELTNYSDLSIMVIHPHDLKIFTEYNSVTELQIRGIDPSKNYLKECYIYSKRVSEILDKYPKAVIYSQGLSVWHNIEKYANRLIVNPHGLEPYQAIGFKDKLISIPFKRIFNKLFKQAAFTISLGGKLTPILTKRAKRVEVIPNATNLPVAPTNKNFDSTKFNVLFVGRFASNKGIQVLMSAIMELNKQGKGDKFIFHLSGKGPLFDNYSTKYKFENVVFYGFTSDEKLDQLYREAHIFVLPTLFEGMPTVVLEAMANKTPVIVTDVGATAELVDNSNGYIIQTNDIKSLSKALGAFVDLSAGQKAELGIVGFEKVRQKFTWTVVAQKHYELFKKAESSLGE